MTLTQYIEYVVDDLGCPKHMKGYDYIVEGIRLMIKKPDTSVCGLYEKVSTHFNTTPASVERAIRHMIKTMLTKYNYESIINYFGNSIRADGVITNGQFIMTLTTAVRRTMRGKEDVDYSR